MVESKIYPIKPCPWCNKTPEFIMCDQDETWMPHFQCVNSTCNINPKSKYISIRKNQKKNPEVIKMKFERCISYWNNNNPTVAYEGILLNFTSISRKT